MARTNKVYLLSDYPGLHTVSKAVGQPRHMSQVKVFAIAPTKKALTEMLERNAGIRYRVESSVNDGFVTWMGFTKSGVPDMDVPALYATGINSDDTIVRLNDDRSITVVARRITVERDEFGRYVSVYEAV